MLKLNEAMYFFKDTPHVFGKKPIITRFGAALK